MATEIDLQILHDFVAADAKRKLLAKHAAAAEKEANLLREQIAEWLTRKGKKSVRRGPFAVSFVPGPVNPKWKDEFIKALGEDAAIQVIESTEPSKRLIVQSRE
jgi:hypothetical protein